jgi:hypothetical protein
MLLSAVVLVVTACASSHASKKSDEQREANRLMQAIEKLCGHGKLSSCSGAGQLVRLCKHCKQPSLKELEKQAQGALAQQEEPPKVERQLIEIEDRANRNVCERLAHNASCEPPEIYIRDPTLRLPSLKEAEARIESYDNEHAIETQ